MEDRVKRKVLEALSEVRKLSKPRSFVQSFDLMVQLRGIDFKKLTHRSEIVELPHGKGKEARIVLFSDTTEQVGCTVLGTKEIETLAKNKKELKKLVKCTDFFLAEPRLMPLVGKGLGSVLGPSRKMPTLVSGDVRSLVESRKKSVKLELRESGYLSCVVGNEGMSDEAVCENICTVLEWLKSKLPAGLHNVQALTLKLSMGKPVKLELW